VLLVVLCDAVMYRGHGFAGYALLCIAAPGLLLLGSSRPGLRASVGIVAGMLLLLAARMIWLTCSSDTGRQ
jgi:type IV secretory pathway VirB2 component (pilin)